MQTLSNLITAAIQLAGGDSVAHGGALWQTEGGRCCPIGWEDCSQAVYVDLKTGAYDYGERGGPGWEDCQQRCPHGRIPPEEPSMPPAIETIADNLRSIGADGLVQQDAECGCELSDLAPCGECSDACLPGWKGAGNEETPDWRMYASKESAAASLREKGTTP